jgi:hypothetical protein
VAIILILISPIAGQAQLVDIATDATDPLNLDDSEPSIAVNPANPMQIAVVTFSGNWGTGVMAPVWWSTDGGTTWTKLFQIPQPPAAAVGALSGPGDQKIAFDAAGNLFIAELGVVFDMFGNPTLIQDFVYRQTGAFGAPLTVGAPYGDDQPHLDVDRTATSPCFNRIYSSWLNTRLAIWQSSVSNSATGGAAMANVAVGNNATFPNRTTRIALAPNGRAYAIYKTREGSVPVSLPGSTANDFENAHFWVKRSDDCGVTWNALGAAGVSVHGTPTVQTFFTNFFGDRTRGKVGRARSSDAWIAVDPGDGDVYAAYVNRDASGFGQIYVARSTNEGLTWTSTRVTNGTNHSAYPEIAVANNGTIGVLYIDFDNSGPNTIFRHRFARSFNNGSTWTDEILQNMDPGPIANAVSGRMWLDYEALTAVGNMFYGVFTGQSIGRTTLQLDPIFFTRSAIDLYMPICHLYPWLCLPPLGYIPGVVRLKCDLRPCIVIDMIPRNCLVKFDCPGCLPNVLCPPWYNFFIDGLDDVWKVGLFDPKGDPAPYYQFQTQSGIVISFRPSEENFIDGQIGNYFFGFEMGPNGLPGKEYSVQMRVERSDKPYRPDTLK